MLNSDSSKLSQQARALADKEMCGDPIDMASGQMVLEQVDVDLPGVLPLVTSRTDAFLRTTLAIAHPRLPAPVRAARVAPAAA